GGNVLLRVGDNVLMESSTGIVAANGITVRGDYGDADPGTGTTMTLRGVIASDASLDGTGNAIPASPAHAAAADGSYQARICGNSDNDTFTLDQLQLIGQTFVYGSATQTPPRTTAPLNDGQDTFTVNQLKSLQTTRPYTDGSGTITRRDTL